MKYDGHELKILVGHEMDGGYVGLHHGEAYKIRVESSFDEPCDCKVEVDGKWIGTFRLSPRDFAVIERPVNSPQRFTFYASGSDESLIAGVCGISERNKGLVQATFTPRKRIRIPKCSLPLDIYDLRGDAFGGPMMRGGGGGMTGLSGWSNQRYGSAGKMELDKKRAVRINIRLRERTEAVSELSDIRETPIPPFPGDMF